MFFFKWSFATKTSWTSDIFGHPTARIPHVTNQMRLTLHLEQHQRAFSHYPWVGRLPWAPHDQGVRWRVFKYTVWHFCAERFMNWYLIGFSSSNGAPDSSCEFLQWSFCQRTSPPCVEHVLIPNSGINLFIYPSHLLYVAWYWASPYG